MHCNKSDDDSDGDDTFTYDQTSASIVWVGLLGSFGGERVGCCFTALHRSLTLGCGRKRMCYRQFKVISKAEWPGLIGGAWGEMNKGKCWLLREIGKCFLPNWHYDSLNVSRVKSVCGLDVLCWFDWRRVLPKILQRPGPPPPLARQKLFDLARRASFHSSETVIPFHNFSVQSLTIRW